jgi:FMN phosphatase YigB (HAD superfamily)
MSRPTLIFDLDDTLVHASLAYDRALRASGIDPKDAQLGSARLLVKERLGERHPSSHQRLLYFKAWLELRREFSAARLLEVVSRY